MGWALVLGALAVACAPGPAPEHDPTGPVAGAWRDASLDADIRFLIQKIRREVSIPRAAVHVVLAPIAPEAHAGPASAATWALVRMHGGATPRGGTASWASVPAVQAWLREEPARRDWVAWLIQVHPGANPTLEIVTCTRTGAWRSGEHPIPDAEPPWPWLHPGAVWRGQHRLTIADRLRVVAGTLVVEDEQGRRRVRVEDGQLRVDPLQTWSRLDRAPLQRWAGEAVPAVGVWDADLRCELRRADDGDGETWTWWLVRGGFSLALPATLRAPGRTVSLAPAPLSWKDGPHWVLLRSVEGVPHLEWYRADLRRWSRPPRRPDPAAELTVGTALDRSLAWPVRSGDLWVRAHLTVPLVHGELIASADGRAWKLPVPTLHGSDGLSPVTAWDWADAVRRRVNDPTAPAWYDWLLAPLRAAEISVDGDELVFRFDQPVPDLPARLRHPALQLADEVLAQRYASHRREGGGLVPRHRGLVRILNREGEPDVRRVLGGDELLPAGGQVHREPDDVIALVPSASAPAPDRRRLAAILLSTTASELVASDDAQWRRRTPVLGQLLPPGQAPPPGPPFTLVVDVSVELDGSDEAARALTRLQLLLESHGIGVVRPPAMVADAVVARLTRLSPRSEDPLLRGLELASWGGAEVLPPLQAAARLEPRDPRRHAAAVELEAELVREGRIVPLWTTPVWTVVPADVQGVGPQVPGMAPLLRDARRASTGPGTS